MWVTSVSDAKAARDAASSRRSTDTNSMSRPLNNWGLRRETPTTSQPADRNLSIAATPSKPLAPVISTLFDSKSSVHVQVPIAHALSGVGRRRPDCETVTAVTTRTRLPACEGLGSSLLVTQRHRPPGPRLRVQPIANGRDEEPLWGTFSRAPRRSH